MYRAAFTIGKLKNSARARFKSQKKNINGWHKNSSPAAVTDEGNNLDRGANVCFEHSSSSY